jgi:hypothetical protein
MLPSSHAAFSVPEQQREQQQASLAVPVLASMLIAYVLPERPSHTLGSFTRHLRGNMAVGIHGQRDRLWRAPAGRRGSAGL